MIPMIHQLNYKITFLYGIAMSKQSLMLGLIILQSITLRFSYDRCLVLVQYGNIKQNSLVLKRLLKKIHVLKKYHKFMTKCLFFSQQSFWKLFFGNCTHFSKLLYFSHHIAFPAFQLT